MQMSGYEKCLSNCQINLVSAKITKTNNKSHSFRFVSFITAICINFAAIY